MYVYCVISNISGTDKPKRRNPLESELLAPTVSGIVRLFLGAFPELTENIVGGPSRWGIMTWIHSLRYMYYMYIPDM
ncbi:uncharacterized protein LAJ45_07414 [Morchella importuna]|uniref:uncharacterized protein n=1 Tax=Morchella importuna TaxID=1174673 RepID=UPI001E8E7A80|nr:uncharacterized protein LAJ45_07414 [Morchella importuna]KAH8148703.1 hypothetical protein LAJ45_07414 [Morchella importuna]